MKKNRMNIFILTVSIVAILSLFLMTGCGKGCGQVPHAGSASIEDTDLSYASIPLCGGCTTSGWGCSTCLWGENCVISTVTENSSEDNDYSFISCNELYYGNSCLGCGYQPDYVYNGFASGTVDGKEIAGCVYGSTESEATYVCGYYDGCACATKTEDSSFAYFAPVIEELVENADYFEE